MRKIKILVKGCIPGHVVGGEVIVDADDEGTPLDLQWRRRLRDAATDGCCEVVAERETPDHTESADYFDDEESQDE